MYCKSCSFQRNFRTLLQLSEKMTQFQACIPSYDNILWVYSSLSIEKRHVFVRFLILVHFHSTAVLCHNLCMDIKQHIYNHNLDNWSDILLLTNHHSAIETKNMLMRVYLLIVKSVTLTPSAKVWNQWYFCTCKECGSLEMKLHFTFIL